MPHCLLCFRQSAASGGSCCGACLGALARHARELPLGWLPSLEGAPVAGYRRSVLFDYRGDVRRLLLRVKVEGDQPGLRLWTHLMTTQPEATQLASWAELIVPAPSSLWGRLRGRLDVAFTVALALAAAHERRLVAAPWHLQWRPRKRAQMSHEARRAESVPGSTRLGAHLSRRWLHRHGELICARRVLLIDDVTTTGRTLLETAAALGVAGPAEVRLLACAGVP